MHRRNFPSILLYGFGLALALSLLFNGFLLYEQSRRQAIYPYEVGSSAHSVDSVSFQQLSDCQCQPERSRLSTGACTTEPKNRNSLPTN